MKRIYIIVFLVAAVLCGTAQNVKMEGLEVVKSLSSDGTSLVEMPYYWFAGLATADDRQTAIEMAQREAYSTISRVFNNAVMDYAARGTLAVDGKTRKALASYWEQFSASVVSGCRPFGEAEVNYNSDTHMYEVTARVAIRGDRYNKMLNAAGQYRPEDLEGDELQQFVDANKAIIKAASGE